MTPTIRRATRATAIVAALAMTLVACTQINAPNDAGQSSIAGDAVVAALIEPDSPQVAEAEAERKVEGAQVREVTLTAAPTTIDLGGKSVESWTFNGTLPGPTIRATTGDVVRATVVNNLDQDLTVHWHGIAIRNDMDGVPDLTQQPIAPGETFVYEFTAPDPGTYMYHPHTGVQLDRGLYGALVVDDPVQPTADVDVPLLLDDWIEGSDRDPDQIFADLQNGGANMEGMMGGMAGMDHGGTSTDSPLGSDIVDVVYPDYIINGRTADSPQVQDVKVGDVVRLRLVNIGSSTPFRVAFGGGKMTVVATDGYPVQPVQTDALLVAMGERYDVEVTIPSDGAFPVVAEAESQGMQGLMVLRTGDAPLPAADVHPAGLDGDLLTLDDLHATTDVTLEDKSPDRTYELEATGDMMSYNWGVKASEEDGVTLPVRQGDRVQITLTNPNMMWHPFHLHGHTFQVVTPDGDGPRKDTVIVAPGETVTIELDADNPGQWAVHCHNIYHAEAGMVTVLNYLE